LKPSEPLVDLAGLLGERLEVVTRRFKAAGGYRDQGEDQWVVCEGKGWSLRLRANRDHVESSVRVRSWTITFESGYPSFEAACTAVGITLTPNLDNSATGHRSLRRPFPDPCSGRIHSLTAAIKNGAVQSVTGFDEPPDWLP